MVDLAALKLANAKRWTSAKFNRRADFVAVAKSLVAAKQRYLTVTAKTGVPWAVIAVIHERESSQNWGASLAQGDPWNQVSIRIPAGRGPFASWEAAAIDALTACAPHLSWNKDWSAGGMLTSLEGYNGMGYAARGMVSPYLWAGSDQYVSGKYIRDGIFDVSAVDRQLGVAGLLFAMMGLDASIKFTDGPATDESSPPVRPQLPPEQPKTIWAAFFSAVLNFFRRKP